MTLCGLVFNMSGVDSDAALSLFGSLVDGRVVSVLCATLHCKVLSDSCGQSGLAVVNMANGTDINVGQGSVECLLCHDFTSKLF